MVLPIYYLGQIKKSLMSFSQIDKSELATPVIGLHYAWALTVNSEFVKAKELVDRVDISSGHELSSIRNRILNELEKKNLTGMDSNV